MRPDFFARSACAEKYLEDWYVPASMVIIVFEVSNHDYFSPPCQ